MSNIPITPEIQQKFNQIDKDGSGTLSHKEVTIAYQQFQFPEISAKLLMQSCTDAPFLDITAFALFDHYVTTMWRAFKSVAQQNQACIDAQQVANAIALLKIQVPPHVASALTSKYDGDKNGIKFGEFLAIGSYLLICQKLMARFDINKDGILKIDFAALASLGMWFI